MSLPTFAAVPEQVPVPCAPSSSRVRRHAGRARPSRSWRTHWRALLGRLALVVGALWLVVGQSGSARADDLGPVPVSAADPSSGSALAPVTLVYFGDYQCPYCKRSLSTLAELRKLYSDKQLRIVYKHLPLAMHTNAKPVAELAVAVHQAGGNAAFLAFHEGAFDSIVTGNFDDLLHRIGVGRAAVDRIVKTGAPAQKVAADLALAQQLGISGTPSFFINGRLLSGAQPTAKFQEVIDAEAASAGVLAKGGVKAGQLYVEAAKKNFAAKPVPSTTAGAAAAAAPAAPKAPPPIDKTVRPVPLAGSASKGNVNAPVTLVAFSDFQCPYCGKVQATLAALEQKYGAQLRMVFKHNPLPFHNRAEAAAEFALEVRARKGDAAFWTAHDKLFAQQKALEDADLEQLATDMGLDPKVIMAAVTAKKHAAEIQADQEVAEDAGATGTPSFLINGRKIAGAQALDVFVALIDEELAHAAELQKKGVPAAQIYTEIQKGAVAVNLNKVAVPAPAVHSPVRGPKTAPITVQMFGDFQCPFCGKVRETLVALEQAFPGQIRTVWRNFPLSFHHNARIAAAAALEARRQKGDAGFWQMHDLLFANQSSLERDALLGYGQTVGLNLTELAAAIDGTRFDAIIDADTKAGQNAGVTGTPAIYVNGYEVRGAQPLAALKRVVRHALADLKKP